MTAQQRAEELYPLIDDTTSDDMRLCSREAYIEGHKAGSIAFAEWLGKNYGNYVPHNNKWIIVIPGIYFTTEKLYEQFNKTTQ
jgi:hypothetical protein